MRANILVIEDCDTDQTLIKSILSKVLNGSVGLLFCKTMAEARVMFSAHSIEVVVLDLGLPDSVGIRSIEQIRYLKQDVPIIVVTADDNHESRLQSIAGGAMQYLVKGDDYSQLPAAVVGALEQSRRGQISVDRFAKRLDAIFRNTESIAQQLNKVQGEVAGMHDLLHGKEKDTPGLIDTVEENTRFRKVSQRFGWTLLGVCLTAIAGLLASLILRG